MKTYSAIEEMYHGKGGRGSVKLSEETIKQVDKVIACCENITQLLRDSPDELEEFETLKEAWDEQLSLYMRDYFESGFRFGVRMGFDILEGE